MVKLKRFAALFDLHYGFEMHRSGPQMRLVKRPVHDIAAFRAVLDFLADFQPHILVLGGDNLNCSFLSRHNKGKPRLVEGMRARDEYEGFEREILAPLEKVLPKGCDKRWLAGNHEAWVDDFLDANPTVEGLVEPHDFLRLTQRGWVLFSYGETTKIGKVQLAHGDVVLRGAGGYIGGNCAKKAVENYSRNIRIGHRHTYQAFTKTSPVDQKDFHTGMAIPALCNRAPEYIRNNPNDFIQGFLFGYFDEATGAFTDYVAVINQGKFYWANKEYNGRKAA